VDDGAVVRLETSSDQVGIGTSTPEAKLDIEHVDSGPFQTGLRVLNPYMVSGEAMNIRVGRTNEAKNVGKIYFQYDGDASDLNRLSLGLFGVGDVVNVMAGGNVGIGTTEPIAKLDVESLGSGPSQRGIRLMNPLMVSGDNLDIRVGRSDNGRNIGRMAFHYMGDGWDENRLSLGPLRETEVLNIMAGGNVGIGTINPSEMLEVAGTVQMAGMKMPKGASAGYVLTSDGIGTGTWQPAGGGGGGGGWMDDGTVVRLETISDVVGIGTTSPGAKLDVRESGFNPGGYFEITNSGSASDAIYATTNGGGSAVSAVNTGAGTGISASSAGGNGIYATSSAGGGYAAGNFYTSTPNTYGLRAESSQYDGLYASTDNSSSAAIRAVNTSGGLAAAAIFEGRVGIGSTSPLQLLHLYHDDAPFIGFDHEGYHGWAIGSEKSSGELQFSRTDPSGSATIMRIETDGEISTAPTVRVNLGYWPIEPTSVLTVNSDRRYSGYFTSDSLNTNTEVIHSEFTGTGGYDATAVYGVSKPQDYYGYGGRFEGGYVGVEGVVNPTGSIEYAGIFGLAQGGSGENYGVSGVATGSGSNYGVYGSAYGGSTNYGGYFYGDVHATGTLTAGNKLFKIDHPQDPANAYLNHFCVESSEMKDVYDGTVVLDSRGEAWVQLPDWFETLNGDYRYQLTCIGGYAPVYIAEKISGNRFQIAGGKTGMEVSWQVTGIRQDRYAEANRIPVEEEKLDRDRGKYLHPEAFGLPESMGIDYHNIREKKEKSSLNN
jgi:hypothetical protein